MSDIQRNRAVALRYLQAHQNRDLAAFDEVLHPDFLHYMHGNPQTKQELMEDIAKGEGLFGAEEIEVGTVAEGDQVAVRYRFRAKDPRSGKQLEFTGQFIAELKDGRIVGGWGEIDRLGILQQLGVLKGPGVPRPGT